jgi:hypothetical protein
MTILDLLSGLRATIELVLWLMVGKSLLGLLAGSQRHSNPVFRLFVFLLRPVSWLGEFWLAWVAPRFRDAINFAIFASLWLVLGIVKFTWVSP